MKHISQHVTRRKVVWVIKYENKEVSKKIKIVAWLSCVKVKVFTSIRYALPQLLLYKSNPFEYKIRYVKKNLEIFQFHSQGT
jgi:hypothetical protein